MTTGVYLALEAEHEAAASALSAALSAAGCTIRRAPPEHRNAEHAATLAQTVHDADVVVVLLGGAAPGLVQEIAAAQDNARPIIPVLVADPPPSGPIAALARSYCRIDLRGGVSPEGAQRVAAAASAPKGGRVVAMLNIKGGVGKTILAANLFAAAHLIDQRAVTFIDLDPQHNLTQYFLPPGERARVRASGATIYSVLGGAHAPDLDIAVPLNRARRGKRRPFDLISGDERLFEFTMETPSAADRDEAVARFLDLVSKLRAHADAVVIDANPCATFLTRLAVMAADHIVAPVRPETYSLTGLNMLEHVVRVIRGRPLRSGEFSVLLNGVNDRTRSDSAGDPDALTRNEIGQAPFFGSALLEDAIPYSGVLRSSPADRYAANPINVTAMMRVGGRPAKEALARAAAAILRRAAS